MQHEKNVIREFPRNGGEMGHLIRNHRWTDSVLGDPANWTSSLKNTVQLILSSSHPMCLWWGPQLIQFYNDAFARSMGVERHPSAFAKRGDRKYWGEAWNIILPHIERIRLGEDSIWLENQCIPMMRNGQQENVYWTSSYTPIHEAHAANNIGGVLMMCTETTKQIVAEQTRKKAEAHWRELFNQAPCFMCALKGPQHIFEFANPRYFNLLGGRDLIGKTVREAIPEAKDQGFEKLLDQAYRTGKAISCEATPLFLAQLGGNVNYMYVDFIYQPIMNSNGEVTGIFVTGSDVTARELAKELLLEDERRKDEFLSVLTHEFRNLLAPILTASEMLIQTSAPDSPFASLGNIICRKMDKLTTLVDDLLDISRSDKKIDLKKEPLELNDVAKLAIESVQTLLTEKQHELIYEPGNRKLFIEGDKVRIVQCLTNLLTNAIKYTDQGGLIQVHLREVDNIAVIEVIDSGVGIAPNVLPKIFDLFIQTKQNLRRSKSGLGIGLSIVRRLIQLHGGSVNAMSYGIGCGARFEICLPLIPEPADTTEKTIEKKLSPMRLLIVDDNVDAADALAKLLRFKGHETVTAYNAEEAMRAVKIFPADIVLLDIDLPDIDGYEVARRIRNNGNTSKLVALTGHGKPHDIQQAFDAGFSTHVTKPVVFAELEYILSNIKNSPQITDSL